MKMNILTLKDLKEYHFKMYDKCQYLENCIKDLELTQEMLPSGYVKILYNDKMICLISVEENCYTIIKYCGRVPYVQEVNQNDLFVIMKEGKKNVQFG